MDNSTGLNADQILLIAIDTLCPNSRLFRIATVVGFKGLDGPQLTEALRDAVAKGYVVVLGPATPLGFLWLTARGCKEADVLRKQHPVEEAAGSRQSAASD